MEREGGETSAVDLFDPITPEIEDKIIEALALGMEMTPSPEDTAAAVSYFREIIVAYLFVNLVIDGHAVFRFKDGNPVFSQREKEVEGE